MEKVIHKVNAQGYKVTDYWCPNGRYSRFTGHVFYSVEECRYRLKTFREKAST